MSPERTFPIGIGGELANNRETAFTYQIDNVVEYVNPDIRSPFKIKEGERTDLGLFFLPAPLKEKTFNVERQKFHVRTGLLGRVVIADTDGREYRDVDLKGIGYVSVQGNVSSFESTEGILNHSAAKTERDISEEWLGMGIRTSRVLSIIKLKELLDQKGNRISIEQAKNTWISDDRGSRRLLQQDDEPVVAVRLFGTKARIKDLEVNNQTYTSDKKHSDLLVKDAVTLVSQELGKNRDEFSINDYGRWFAENLGQQIGLIHKNGWTHNMLTTQNITLDGRIVDLASVKYKGQKTDDVEQFKETIANSLDIERAIRALLRLYNSVSTGGEVQPGEKKSFEELFEMFREAYLDELKVNTTARESLKMFINLEGISAKEN